MKRLTATEIPMRHDVVGVLMRALHLAAPGHAQQPLSRLDAGFPVYVSRADAVLLSSIGVDVEDAAPPPAMPGTAAMHDLADRIEAVVGSDGVPFGPPASTEDVAIVEARVGGLPRDYKDWLGVATGYDRAGPFGPWELTPLPTAVATHRMRAELHRDDPTWWRPSWFDFARNGAGDSLCLDLERGGVLEFRHDHHERPRLAGSFTTWLTRHVEALERGDWLVVEHQGRFDGVVHRTDRSQLGPDVAVRGESASERDHRLSARLDDPAAMAGALFRRLQEDGALVLEPGTFPLLHVLPAIAEGLATPHPAWGVAKALRGCPGLALLPLPGVVQAAIDALRAGR